MDVQNCFGPLGELCAFLGAVGFIFTFFGLIAGVYQAATQPSNEVPFFLKMATVGGCILILVIVLALINQAFVPVGCGR